MTTKEYMEKYLEILSQRKEWTDDLYRTHMNSIAYDAGKYRGEGSIAQHATSAMEQKAKGEVYEEVIKDLCVFLKAVEEGKVE